MESKLTKADTKFLRLGYCKCKGYSEENAELDIYKYGEDVIYFDLDSMLIYKYSTNESEEIIAVDINICELLAIYDKAKELRWI